VAGEAEIEVAAFGRTASTTTGNVRQNISDQMLGFIVRVPGRP